MRHFVYFSPSARTSGKIGDDLMKAGRMDIAIHSIISAFFLSKKVRDDVIMHLVFYGGPDPPKHIEIHSSKAELSKKDVAKVISKALYKYKGGEKKETLQGVFVEKKSFLNVVQELIDDGKGVFILDKRGKNIRDVKMDKNVVFLVGDHEGFPKKEIKRLKKSLKSVSVGPEVYFASQVITIINNELDIR